MSIKKKLIEDIELLKSQLVHGSCASQIAMQTYCKEEAYNDVISLINALHDEPVSGDLEKAAENYIAPIENDEGLDYINFNGRDIKDGFIAGAEWQKNQLSEIIGQLKKEEV